MKIKLKIFLGFLTLVLMLALAGVYSIIEFTRISKSVHSILEDNYKTIEASKDMLEAIEREDSGILMLMIGQFREGRRTIAVSDSAFRTALDIARHNLTETDEELYVDRIENAYAHFCEIIEFPIVNTEKQGNIPWYETRIDPAFREVKIAVNELMDLNQQSMYIEAVLQKEKSKRAIMPGIVAIVAGILFSFVFSIFINYYFVSPVKRIVSALKNYKRGTPFSANIETNDEIKDLETSIHDLILRI